MKAQTCRRWWYQFSLKFLLVSIAVVALLALLIDLNLLAPDADRDVSAYPEITGELHHAVVQFLAGTPSKIFILTQEDLFKEANQQNVPGTTTEYPNWSLKMKYTVEQLRADHEAQAFSHMFRNVVDRSGRNQRRA